MNIIIRGLLVFSILGYLSYAKAEKVEEFLKAIEDGNLTHIKNDLKLEEIQENLRESSDAISKVFFYLDSVNTDEILDRREKIALSLLGSGVDMYTTYMGRTLLEEAIKENYFELVKYLLEKGDIEKFKALSSQEDFFSFVRGKPILNLLIAKKLGKLEYRNNSGDTVLHLILSRGLKSKHGLGCQNLGNLSQFIAVENKQGDTPLDKFVSYVSSKEEKQCFVDILSQRKSIKEKEGKLSSLLMNMISRNFSLEAYKLAIEKSEDINFVGYRGETAFLEAIKFNNVEVIQLLLNKNADIHALDQYGNSLLMSVINSEGKASIAKLLIEKNININITNEIGETALFLAKKKKIKELVKILEKKNAKISTKEEIEHRYTIKEYMSALTYKKVAKARELILSGKVSINTLVNGDESPLSSFMRTSGAGNDELLQMINFLIDTGIDLNLGKDTAETLLAKALEYNRVNIAKKLMKRGAKLEGDEVMHAFTYLKDKRFIVELVKQEPKLLMGVNMFKETLLTDLADDGKKNLKFFNQLLKYVDVKSENKKGTYNNLFRLVEEHGKNTEIKPFVESLLTHGYSTSTRLHNGKNILMVALESAANLDVVKLIMGTNSLSDFMGNFGVNNEKLDLDVKSKDGRGLAHFIALAKKNVLQYMIKKGVKVGVHGGHDDSTPLMIAIKNNRKENIALLLDKGIINHEDKYGKTALNYVEEYDYSYMLQSLKRIGAIANTDAHIEKKSTAYTLAKKEPTGLEKLLKSGDKKAFLKAYKKVKKDELDDFIGDVLRYGDVKLFKVLLDNGMSSDMVDSYGYSLLASAVYFDNMEVVKFLITKKADIHKKSEGKMSLFKVSAHSSVAMMKFLIKEGIETKEERDDIVSEALGHNKKEIAEYLLKQGFPFDKKNLTDDYIRHYISKGEKETIEFLLSHGLDINHKVHYAFHKEPLLIHAIAQWENGVAKLLIDKGADIHALIEYDSGNIFKSPPTALAAAIQRNNKELVSLLLEKGAKVDSISKEDDIAPLLVALQNKHAKIAQMIIEQECEVNVVNKENNVSALMYAAFYGYFNTVKMLLDKGADINHKDSEGRTAYDIAMDEGYGFITEYLKL